VLAPHQQPHGRRHWFWWAAGVGVLLGTLAVLGRAPLPAIDEIYIVSIARTDAFGPQRVPRLTPPLDWVDNYAELYGPVYFKVEAAVLRTFGLSIVTGRIVGWTFAVLICAATAWMVLLVGGSREFAAIAFFVVAVSPDLSPLARNGRMDSMAVGFELIALAAMLAAWQSPRRSAVLNLITGACWALAILTTPRTLPLVAGLLLALPLILCDAPRRKAALQSLAFTLVIVLAGLSLWTRSLGLNPISWLWWIWDGVKDDPYMLVLRGHKRWWAIGPASAIMPTITALVAVGIILIAINRTPVTEAKSRRNIIWFLIAATMFNVLFYIGIVNLPFIVSPYFVLPLFAVLLMATAALRNDVKVYRGLVVLWLLIAAAFSSIRVVAHVAWWQTWDLRNPKLIENFVREHVPPGGIVFADDQYYYYPVDSAGVEYRTFNPAKPGLTPAQSSRTSASDESRFLLWPVADPNSIYPPWFECARPHVVATYEGFSEAVGIERGLSFAFFPYLHGYPTTILYRVPPGCPTPPTPKPGH
jgi:hypothetical protein